KVLIGFFEQGGEVMAEAGDLVGIVGVFGFLEGHQFADLALELQDGFFEFEGEGSCPGGVFGHGVLLEAAIVAYWRGSPSHPTGTLEIIRRCSGCTSAARRCERR